MDHHKKSRSKSKGITEIVNNNNNNNFVKNEGNMNMIPMPIIEEKPEMELSQNEKKE